MSDNKLAGFTGGQYPIETTKLGKGEGNFGRGGGYGRLPNRWKVLKANNNSGTLENLDPKKPK